MDVFDNPYEPGAGRRPPELAGRAGIIERIEVAMTRCEQGRGARGHVLHGRRGVGKTVLLNDFHRRAARRGWVVAIIEGDRDEEVASLIAQELYLALRKTTGRWRDQLPSRLLRALGVFRAFSITVDPGGSYSFGVDVDAAIGSAATTGRADTGNLSTDLTELFTELGEAAADLGVGVMLLIDEMQELTGRDLASVNRAAHQISQGSDPLPVMIIGAGLPSLPAVLADANSYAERLYEYHGLDALDRAAATDALVLPARALDVEWTTEALDEVLAASGGYPFILQLCGKDVWNHARTSPIQGEDAIMGVSASRRELDEGMYLARWNRATPVQRQLLRAMASYGEGAVTVMSDVAARLGRKYKDISVPREQLIKKGMIYAPERGLIAFTVPGMADYITRQPE